MERKNFEKTLYGVDDSYWNNRATCCECCQSIQLKYSNFYINLTMSSSLISLKYQSNSITNINKCILNNSTSKRLNSFTKAIRFPKQHFPPYFFNRSKTQAHSKIEKKPILFPTIPKADRVFYFPQQKQLSNNPSPLDYKVKYQDEMNKVKHKGETIGMKLSRNSSK